MTPDSFAELAARDLAHAADSPFGRWYLNDGLMTAILWLGGAVIVIGICTSVYDFWERR